MSVIAMRSASIEKVATFVHVWQATLEMDITAPRAKVGDTSEQEKRSVQIPVWINLIADTKKPVERKTGDPTTTWTMKLER